MRSNGLSKNYCGVLEEHLNTCAKGTKWRVYIPVYTINKYKTSWNKKKKKKLQKNENETKINMWGMRTLSKCN